MATPRLSVRANQSHRHVVVGKKCCFRMFFDKLAFSPPKFACTREFEQGSSTRTKAFLIKKLTSVSKSSLDFFSSTFKLTSLRPTSSLALGSSLSARKLQSNHINDLLLCLVDLLAHLSEDLLFHHLQVTRAPVAVHHCV